MPSPHEWYEPLPDEAPEHAHYTRWAAMTRTPPWAHALVATFFGNRPCAETQAAYRAAGLQAYDYWRSELRLMFGSTLTMDDEFLGVPFLQYYVERYAAKGNALAVRDMQHHDKQDLFVAFAGQLGMHASIFPVKLEEVMTG